jgi:hypothetical protein
MAVSSIMRPGAQKMGILNRKIAEFSAVNLDGEIEPKRSKPLRSRKSELRESITLQ